jgi:hypothetical protein
MDIFPFSDVSEAAKVNTLNDGRDTELNGFICDTGLSETY